MTRPIQYTTLRRPDRQGRRAVVSPAWDGRTYGRPIPGGRLLGYVTGSAGDWAMTDVNGCPLYSWTAPTLERALECVAESG